jgi:hypothetical protein
MYAGLKIEDEAALLEAKSFREKWLCSIRADLAPVNIDLALAQIAEMKAAQKPASPPTWNDALNAMSVEEKAEWMLANAFQLHRQADEYAWKYRKTGHYTDNYKKWMADYFASPYDGGKAQDSE